MTTNPPRPRRRAARRAKTWSSFGNLGRKPSEYEIVTHNMNHTVGATPLEMGPDVHGNRGWRRHRDGIALKVAKLDRFRDPDQMTYRKYTQAMDEQETYIDGLLQQYGEVRDSDRGLEPAGARLPGRDLDADALSRPWPADAVGLRATARPFELHRQLRCVPDRRPAAPRAARRLPNAPARRRASGSAASARGERATWQSDADWQPVRQAIERLLVCYDWDQAFVGLNLVVKPVADELFLKVFADLAREHGDDFDALIAENLFLDAQRSRRWTIACVPGDGRGRRRQREGAARDALRSWYPTGQTMIESASRLLARHAARGNDPGHCRSCIDRLGLRSCRKPGSARAA